MSVVSPTFHRKMHDVLCTQDGADNQLQSRPTLIYDNDRGAALLTVGRSYVGNDVTRSTSLDRACSACSYENLPKSRSYRVSSTAPSGRYYEALHLTKARFSDWCIQKMHALVRSSSFSKAQGLHNTGPWSLFVFSIVGEKRIVTVPSRTLYTSGLLQILIKSSRKMIPASHPAPPDDLRTAGMRARR